MKKILIVSFFMIIFALSGCGNNATQTESASTGQTTKETQKAQESEKAVDYSTYAGSWAGDGVSLDIFVENSEIMNVNFYFPNSTGSRLAAIEDAILISSIKNNSTTFAFVDSWETSGVFIITFKEDSIQCQIKDTVQPEGGVLWCVGEGIYNLTRYENDEADSLNEEFQEEEQTYNPYKTSGILERLGMTEEEFRNSCYDLSLHSDIEDRLRFGDLLEYPNNYKGRHFTYITDGLWKGVRVDDKGTTQDGNIFYVVDDVITQTQQIYFDVRDDVYSPTISKGENIIPYAIFTGVQTLNGTDYICFNLISLE